MTRRHDDIDDSGALSRAARPTWKVLALISSVLAAAGGGLASAKALARAEAENVVSSVDSKIERHLAEMRGKQAVMADFVEESRAAQCANAVNLYRLCLNARIQCEPVNATCRGGPK